MVQKDAAVVPTEIKDSQTAPLRPPCFLSIGIAHASMTRLASFVRTSTRLDMLVLGS